MDEITFGMLLPTLKLSKLQRKNICEDYDLFEQPEADRIVYPELLSALIFADFLLQLRFLDADQRELITREAGKLREQLRGTSESPPVVLAFIDGQYFGIHQISGVRQPQKFINIRTGEPFDDPAYIPKESLVYNLEEMFRRKIQEILMKAPTNGERQEDDPTLA